MSATQNFGVFVTTLCLFLAVLTPRLAAQDEISSRMALARDYFKNGEATLRAFVSVSAPNRDSVVKLDLNGSTIALATVIDATGMAITKSSEIKPGKLTAWLASGNEVDVDLLGRDDENDLALVKVHAEDLRPVRWAAPDVLVGQWVVTPGITELPQAVGIVSVPTRKILPPRALIGVQLEQQNSTTRIERILPGLGAEQAGLKPGDLILAVNGSAVSAGEGLISRLREFREGETVTVRVQRDDQEFDASIKMMLQKRERGRREFNRADLMDHMGTEPSERADDFSLAIQHDTALQAWQCGGPLLNLDGRAIGLNIARAGRVASYALPSDVVKVVIQRLVADSARHGSQEVKTSREAQKPAN